MSHQKKNEEQTDIEIMKSRKMIELIEQAVSRKKDEIIRQHQVTKRKSDREFLSMYLYDKGEEVLEITEAQFPIQTRTIVRKIVELIKSMEIKNRISGGELLALFRSIGMNLRINTTIQIEDHGKLVSLSDKLKQRYEELGTDA
jgi:DNA-binding TFAR19-related protein (PDSD5 family)